MAKSKINKILFDVFLPQEASATALHKAKDLLHNRIVGIINQQFDAMEESIFIDKLEIDLGEIQVQDLEEILKMHLRNHLKKNGVFPDSSDAYFANLAKNNRDTDVNVDGSSDQTKIELLLFYLQRGYWTWSLQTESEENVNIFLKHCFSDQDFLLNLLSVLRCETFQTFQRFVLLVFDNAKYKMAVMQSLQAFYNRFDDFVALMPKGFEKRILQDGSFEQRFFYALFQASELNTFEQLKEIMRISVAQTKLIEEKGALTVTQWQKAIQAVLTIDELKDVIANIQTSLLDAPSKKVNKMKPTKETDTIAEGAILKESEPSVGDDMTEDINSAETLDRKGFDTAEIIEVDKINITNAGLVLLHVYLPFVFKELNWIDARKQFVSKEKQERAVHFLQYLITGKSSNSEHLMVLNKLLCGCPIHLPIKRKCHFSKAEKEVVTHMIESLKEHWVVMRNTSAQGLIESFILRNGIIQQQDADYLLKVERKTIDVLIDSLPFGFNIIKFPWNDYIIHTEW